MVLKNIACALVSASFFAAGLLAAGPVLAEPPAALEISADQGVIWDRKAQSYTARGRAQARQGDLQVTADSLTAFYTDADKASDITRVVAEGQVILQAPPYVAHADRAEYDLAAGQAVLTGEDLRVLTPRETLTARDRLTYDALAGRMTAEGDARVTRGTDTLTAPVLTATIVEDETGARRLDAVRAEGGVVIVTPRETLRGERGLYRAEAEEAELIGRVRIEQGPNRLEGARAQVNLRTGVSRITGAAAPAGADAPGRVKGVFFPKGGVTPGAAISRQDNGGSASETLYAPLPEGALPALAAPAGDEQTSEDEDKDTP